MLLHVILIYMFLYALDAACIANFLHDQLEHDVYSVAPAFVHTLIMMG